MPLISTDRERRYWIFTIAVVVAVWSTLGLAGSLTGYLRERNLLDAAYVLGFVVMIFAIAFGELKRPDATDIWVATGIATAYWMVGVRMGVPPDERTHLFEYGLVAVLIYRALCERRKGGRAVRAPAALAMLSAAVLGWIDECIQGILPGRVYDLRDVGVNAVAAVGAITGVLVLSRLRRWRGR